MLFVPIRNASERSHPAANIVLAAVLILVAIMFSACCGDSDEPTPEEVQALKDEWNKRQDLENRIWAVVPKRLPSEDSGDDFNILGIRGLNDEGALVFLYSFNTAKECRGAVFFGETRDEDRLVTDGCHPDAL